MQRFLAFEFDEQKTTEHSNPSDADAADGYFNEADLRHHNMLNLKPSLPEKCLVSVLSGHNVVHQG